MLADVAADMTPDKLERLRQAYATAVENTAEYRRSRSGWAGGNHFVTVRVDPDDHVSARGEAIAARSRNGKWTGSNSHLWLTVTKRLLVRRPPLWIVAGCALLDVEGSNDDCVHAHWAVRALGFDLRVVEGYVIHGKLIQSTDLNRAQRTFVKQYVIPRLNP